MAKESRNPKDAKSAKFLDVVDAMIGKTINGKKVYDYKDFMALLGWSDQTYRQIRVGKQSVTGDQIIKSVDVFGVNPAYYASDDAPMFAEEPQGEYKTGDKKQFGEGEKILPVVITEDHKEKITFIPEACYASFVEDYPNGNYHKYTFHFSIPKYNNGSAIAMEVRSDSMYPKLRSGDMVIAERVFNKEYVSNGEIYIIFHKYMRPSVKRIRMNKDAETYYAYGDNPEYPGMDLRLEDTLFLFQWRF